ncbi:c-type cytochrome [Methylobacterium sp. NEAU K]|uniref:c-type cytochrome n=1 Tax=Methylobacterium sp. NEAU K TaxID=3064946 RepID=UPI0027326B4E|nr:c-type cytochrome [Methylobacterium sp. NEAU K]MDP4003318.1 c-type cytochrome [Methylobacterium sp. NEAU K]
MGAHNRSLGAALGFCLLAGPAMAQDASGARGGAFARAICARCHAIRARGASPMREAPPFRSLAERFPIDDLADVLVEGVERRHPAMPDFRLAPAEAADLTAYLRTLRR